MTAESAVLQQQKKSMTDKKKINFETGHAIKAQQGHTLWNFYDRNLHHTDLTL